MLVFSTLTLVMAITASTLCFSLARKWVADTSIRRLWVALSVALGVTAVLQLVYFLIASNPGVVAGTFSMMIIMVLMLFATALMFKTLSYIKAVNSINGVKIVDDTTGAYNRTYLEQRLSNEVARCHRYGSPLSVVSLSIIDFNGLQQEYGHQAGGIAQKKLATKLTYDLLRETDVVTCIEHGRFVLILPDTPESSVDGLITRLHGALDGMEVISGAAKEQSVVINVKFGKSHCSLQTDNSEELIERSIESEMPVYEEYQAAA